MRRNTRILVVFLLGASLAACAALGLAQSEAPPARSRILDVVSRIRPDGSGGWPEVIATSRPAGAAEQQAPALARPALPQPAPGAPPIATAAPWAAEAARPAPGDGGPPTPAALPLLPATGGALVAPAPAVSQARPAPLAAGAPQGTSLRVEKLAPTVVTFGKSLAYEIVLRNVGAVAVHSVLIEEQLPPGTRLIAAEPRPETRGHTLLWQVGSVAPGDEARFRVEVQPAAEGEFATNAVVTCSTTCPLRAQVARPGLSVTVTAPPAARVGDEVTFTIQLVNNTGLPMRRILLRDRLPAGLQHAAGDYIEAELPGLAPGEKTTVPLKAVATRPGRQVNQIMASADGGPEVRVETGVEVSPRGAATPTGDRGAALPPVARPDGVRPVSYLAPAEGEGASVPPGRLPESIRAPAPKAEPPIAATSLPAVTLHVVARDDVVEVGGETVYEIRVLNQGNAPAADVQIAAAVGEGMALLAAEGPVRREIQGREVIFEPLAGLEAHSRAVYHVRARGVQPGNWRFKAYLQGGQMQRPVSQEVVTEVYTDQVPASAAPRRGL